MSELDPTMKEQLAAEYALGVLTVAERADAERRIRSDGAFADLVAWWEGRLSPMIDAVPEQVPPRVIWMRIAAQLGIQKPASGSHTFWNSVVTWRAATGVFAMAAAAAVAALVLVPGASAPTVAVPPQQAPLELTSVGLLRGDDSPTSFAITFDRAGKRLIITPVAAGADPAKSYELWLLPEGGAPESIGVLNDGNVVTIGTEKLVGPNGATASLAVSVEPKGGSPTGLPTGPVIASGQLQPI